jgi:hypothetical protein
VVSDGVAVSDAPGALGVDSVERRTETADCRMLDATDACARKQVNIGKKILGHLNCRGFFFVFVFVIVSRI